MADEKLPEDAANLVIEIMSANQNNLNATMNSLYEDAENRAKFAEAEIAAIRIKVAKLFENGWMPTESAIIEATYPSRVEIQKVLAYRKTL